MAQSSFLPVEEFLKLLRQLKIVKSLTLTLHKEICILLNCLPTPSSGKHSFQIALWPKFHSFRLKEVPHIWKVAEGIVPGLDPILVQKATLLYLTVIMNNVYPTCEPPKVEKQH